MKQFELSENRLKFYKWALNWLKSKPQGSHAGFCSALFFYVLEDYITSIDDFDIEHLLELIYYKPKGKENKDYWFPKNNIALRINILKQKR